jgi:uncharacterized protein YbcC (UPF0753/DUF2309 family)
VRHLVNNQWLHLFRIGPDGANIEHYQHGTWTPLG